MAPETKEESATDDAILKAVAERLKFFYSDANVRSDYFMRQKLLKSPDGFIPIEVLLKFNSIKCHTTDAAVVVKAAKTLGELLSIKEDETAIGRAVPFNMSQMNDNIPLSLYVKNLPLTEVKAENDDDKPPRQKYGVSVSELRPLFEPYGTVALVKFRFKQPESSDGQKSPKKKRWSVPVGAAFVEYETADELKAAAEELCTIKGGETVKAKKVLELGGNKLEVMTMKEWVDSKKEKKSGDSKEQHKKVETPQKEDESKKRDREAEEAAQEEEEEEEFNIDWKPKTVISIKGLSDSCDREALRAVMAEFWSLDDKQLKDKIYCDFSRGQTSGAIRFTEPSDDIAKVAEKINSGDILIAGEKVESASVLDGEEEKKYWQDFIEFKRKQVRHRKEERGSSNKKKKFRRDYRRGSRD